MEHGQVRTPHRQTGHRNYARWISRRVSKGRMKPKRRYTRPGNPHQKDDERATFMPTPDQIAEAARRIREDGYTDKHGDRMERWGDFTSAKKDEGED